VSEPVTLSIDNAVPVLETVSPNRFRGDALNIVLTVTGRNFVNGSKITVGTRTLDTTFVSATQLTAPLPPPLPLGKTAVTVVNGPPGGGISNIVEIEGTALPPTLSD